MYADILLLCVACFLSMRDYDRFHGDGILHFENGKLHNWYRRLHIFLFFKVDILFQNGSAAHSRRLPFMNVQVQ